LRITLVISSLWGGGAERVAVNMANYWAGKGWEVTILTFSHGPGPPAYDLLPEVQHRDLAPVDGQSRRPDRESLIESVLAVREILAGASEPERHILTLNLEPVARLRHVIKETRPDAVISFIDLTNVRVLLATMELGLPVVVSEHCDPHFNAIGAGADLLRRRLYPRASYVVALTDEAMSYFSAIDGVRGKIIPNPVLPPPDPAAEAAPEKKPGMMLMGMGRLSHEKGFDLLLRAFALLSNDHPAWSLEIWGHGYQLSWLQELAACLGIADRVRFPGFTRAPGDAMRRADLFAMSSLCEGFPMSFARRWRSDCPPSASIAPAVRGISSGMVLTAFWSLRATTTRWPKH